MRRNKNDKDDISLGKLGYGPDSKRAIQPVPRALGRVTSLIAASVAVVTEAVGVVEGVAGAEGSVEAVSPVVKALGGVAQAVASAVLKEIEAGDVV